LLLSMRTSSCRRFVLSGDCLGEFAAMQKHSNQNAISLSA